MARLNIELDRPTFVRLVDRAVIERRPVAWQAEEILRRVLACPQGVEGEGSRPASAGQPPASASPFDLEPDAAA